MRYLYCLLFTLLVTEARAQISSPDTVCVGTTVNFVSIQPATTYTWEFSPFSVIQTMSTPIPFFSSTILNTPSWNYFTNDNGNYYMFISNYYSEHLVRLDYGNDIHSTPVVTDLGSLGMASSELEGIDMVKDSATGNWFGVIVDNGSMGILSFGSSLSNTPTCVVTPYPTHMYWTHQVTIKRYMGGYHVFIANRNSGISRFDFGSSLTNPPAITDIPNPSTSVYTPCNFCIYEESNNWYMLVTSLVTNALTLYSYGPNLLNNAPTGAPVTTPAGMLDLPRYVNLLKDCNGNLIAYQGNETGNINVLNFSGSITNTPTFTTVGHITGQMNDATPCAFSGISSPAYADSFSFMTVDVASGTIYQYFPLQLAPQDTVNYYNPMQPYTFTTTGTFNISLTLDMGYTSGTSTFCKGIVVVAGFPGTTVDTAFCAGNSITLDPTVPTGTILTWSTGYSGPSITVSTGGTYWAASSGGSCGSSDTFNVVVNPQPAVDLGPDQTICSDTSVTLQSNATYTSPNYLWSTGSTSASITPTATGTYWLQVSEGACTASDTVDVTINPTPVVELVGNTVLCHNVPVSFNVPEPPGAQYSWSTGSTDSAISISEPGTYSLTVSLNGCKTSASVNIEEGDSSGIDLGPLDTSLCIGQTLQLDVNNNSATWSTGQQGGSINVSFPGKYWVTIPEQCGVVTDTMTVGFHMCDIAFPSAFTPNGDGLNDFIGVVGTLKYYSDFSLAIYNRWGQRVFYTTDIYAGWDGNYNGSKQDLGTFCYLIYYTIEGKQHMMKGNFELIR